MKNLRNATVFLAAVSLLFFIAKVWFDIQINENVLDIIELCAGILVALGILCDTGDEALPITKENVLEKLKSPIAVGAIFALVSYIAYKQLGIAEADVLMKILDTIVIGLFGFSVYNNPNSRTSIR
jgi:uncharacterized membrane protein